MSNRLLRKVFEDPEVEGCTITWCTLKEMEERAEYGVIYSSSVDCYKANIDYWIQTHGNYFVITEIEKEVIACIPEGKNEKQAFHMDYMKPIWGEHLPLVEERDGSLTIASPKFRKGEIISLKSLEDCKKVQKIEGRDSWNPGVIPEDFNSRRFKNWHGNMIKMHGKEYTSTGKLDLRNDYLVLLVEPKKDVLFSERFYIRQDYVEKEEESLLEEPVKKDLQTEVQQLKDRIVVVEKDEKKLTNKEMLDK